MPPAVASSRHDRAAAGSAGYQASGSATAQSVVRRAIPHCPTHRLRHCSGCSGTVALDLLGRFPRTRPAATARSAPLVDLAGLGVPSSAPLRPALRAALCVLSSVPAALIARAGRALVRGCAGRTLSTRPAPRHAVRGWQSPKTENRKGQMLGNTLRVIPPSMAATVGVNPARCAPFGAGGLTPPFTRMFTGNPLPCFQVVARPALLKDRATIATQ